MSEAKPPLPGRIVGYAIAVVVVAASARAVWELLSPLVPVLLTGMFLLGIVWFMLRRL